MTNSKTPRHNANLLDHSFALPQRLLPHHALSAGAHWLTRIKRKPVKNVMIRGFRRAFNIDLDEAVVSQHQQFTSFNDFFTRELKPNARPIAAGDNTLVSPADGAISQTGKIAGERIFQAKGRSFTLTELLGGDSALAQQFHGGDFATIYLSPRDYHRVHMPLAGKLTRMRHIPGRLFSVNARTTRAVNRLFARNERVVCVFDTAIGSVALILVGALFVASMETTWHGAVTGKKRRITDWNYASADAPQFTRGDEMGRFNMGSTVVLLFGKDCVDFDAAATQPAHSVKMGEALGSLVS